VRLIRREHHGWKRFAGLPIDDMYGRRAGSRRRVVTAPLATAIQFPSGHPAAACVVVGGQAADEVRQNATNLAVEIPDQLWTDLREQGLCLIQSYRSRPRAALRGGGHLQKEVLASPSGLREALAVRFLP